MERHVSGKTAVFRVFLFGKTHHPKAATISRKTIKAMTWVVVTVNGLGI
jgi:hypothetical protein